MMSANGKEPAVTTQNFAQAHSLDPWREHVYSGSGRNVDGRTRPTFRAAAKARRCGVDIDKSASVGGGKISPTPEGGLYVRF